MPGDLLTSPGALLGFLFVLARVSGIFVFAPLPGVKNGPDALRVLVSLAITVALFPLWPKIGPADQGISSVTAAIAAEAGLGLSIGLAVAFIMEALQMAAQISGIQAGYGYASTIDPASQADSPVLLVVAQLFAGLLFFATGLDREVLRVCAGSFRSFPPGKFHLSSGLAQEMIALSSGIFTMGFRLALPVIALLGMVDLSLALLGRVNSQLQLLTLAFPAKMLAALALLAFTSVLFRRVFTLYADQVMAALRHFVLVPAAVLG
ncbi:MAG: flagellar biosynthetic protein FliR [Acidobacteriota bacterium]|nr:flagellar biosynthetic protein FliR [Acidobacteriota bacterium]